MKKIIYLLILITLILTSCWNKENSKNNDLWIDKSEEQVIILNQTVDELWVWEKWDSWTFEVTNWFSN